MLDEPTAILFDKNKNLVAIGIKAVERSLEPQTELIYPLRRGTPADAAMLELYVTKLLNPYGSGLFSRQHVVVSVPSASSPIERRIVRETVQASGPDNVHVIEHVLAGALGAGIALHEPIGAMVVDVGAGITEAALVSLGAVVAAASIRSGGLDVDQGIQAKLKRDYSMLVPNHAAEEIKLMASNVIGLEDEEEAELPLIEARGQSVLEQGSVTAILETADIAPILRDHWNGVVEAVKETLVQAPPELGQDLFSSGITLIGGAAQAPALARAIRKEFGIPVTLVTQPDHAVVMGAAKCLEAPDAFSDLFLGERGLA